MVYKHAIGYARFSSKGQEGNTSIDRQTTQIEAWCADAEIPLIGEVQSDEGLSAFDGTNLTEGKLGVIIETAREKGYPPNTLLVVENLDRLSRGDLLESQMLIKKIFDAGLSIKSLADAQIYSEHDNGLTHVILQLTTFERAHQESKLKSDRVIGSFAARYEEAKSGGKLIMPTIPNWLKFDKETERGVVIEKRKKQILQIVEFYLENDVGLEKLTTTINSVWKWEPWQHANQANKSGLWTKSYVGRLLRNPALIGHFQFMVSPVKLTPSNKESSYWKYVDQSQLIDGKWKFGDVIKDYFPPVIDEETFYRLQNKINKNNSLRKGVSSKDSVRNLFTSLIFCKCGAKFHYMGKGRGKAYLVCASKCGVSGVNYQTVEQHLLENIPLNDGSDIARKNEVIRRKNEELEGKIAADESYLKSLQAKLRERRSPTLMDEVIDIEGAIEERKSQIEPLLEEPTHQDHALTVMFSIDDDEWRTNAKYMIRRLMESVVVTQIGKGYHVDTRLKSGRRIWGYFEIARKPKGESEWFYGKYLKYDFSDDYDERYTLDEWLELATLVEHD